MDPIDKEKTAFTLLGKGLFHLNLMCFGLTNAPATFERLMERVFLGRLRNVCMYLCQISWACLFCAGFGLDPDKIQAVRDWSVPQTVKEVRYFVGFTTYYTKIYIILHLHYMNIYSPK